MDQKSKKKNLKMGKKMEKMSRIIKKNRVIFPPHLQHLVQDKIGMELVEKEMTMLRTVRQATEKFSDETNTNMYHMAVDTPQPYVIPFPEITSFFF